MCEYCLQYRCPAACPNYGYLPWRPSGLKNMTFKRGIWLAGPGIVMAVMALFMVAGYNDTAYYPSSIDLQSSLTISNSCSSEFTLRTMATVSLIIPFVVAYIAYFWRKMDKKQITTEEIENTEKY